MGIIEKNFKDILYYEIDGFNYNDKINHLFSSRVGWRQDKIFEDLSQILNIEEDNIFSAKQVHGTDVVIINKEDFSKKDIGEKDGLITDVKNIALCTYHADCVPIYFYDNKKQVIGLAHAGWKGTLNDINKNMIKIMIEHFGSDIKDIKIAIGPSIGSCCYEIGQDVLDLFLKKYSDYKNIFFKKEERVYLNLWEVNKNNLLNLGIEEKNISLSEACTSCNIDKFYSYRKEKGTKNRMIASIMLKE